MVSSNPHIVEYQVLNGYSQEWALPNQSVFSTIAVLLHILSNHPEYSNRTTSAIQSFVEQTIKKIRDSTYKNSRRSPLRGSGHRSKCKQRPGVLITVSKKSHKTSPEVILSPRWPTLKLSVGYYARTNHFRTVYFLSLYHHHLTSASSSVTLSPHQVSFFVVS